MLRAALATEAVCVEGARRRRGEEEQRQQGVEDWQGGIT